MNAPTPTDASLFRGKPAAELLPLDLIDASPTNPRSVIDRERLEGLAQSIGKQGVHTPILVRPKGARFENVDGHRRVAAAKIAGLAEIPAVVRDMTDLEALEAQCTTSAQHEPLAPLDEAAAFDRLHREFGYDVAEIAERVGRSETYVRSRITLNKLCPAAREFVEKGLLSPAVAVLVARIPVPSLQEAAAKEVVADEYNGQPLTLAEAREHIRDRYMLRLDAAPFDVADAKLVPAAGACGLCRKRTGNQPELFGDIAEADTCTDPTCFAGKREAWHEKRAAEAEAKGLKVLRGKEADAERSGDFWVNGTRWVNLGLRCPLDRNGVRSWGEILGKKIKPTLIENKQRDDFLEAFPRERAEEMLREKGLLDEDDAADDEREQKDDRPLIERASALGAAFRLRIWRSILSRHPRAISPTELRVVLEALLLECEIGWEIAPAIAEELGVEYDTDSDEPDDAILRVVEAVCDLPPDEWGRWLVAAALGDGLVSWSRRKNLARVAEAVGLDLAVIESDARTAFAADEPEEPEE